MLHRKLRENLERRRYPHFAQVNFGLDTLARNGAIGGAVAVTYDTDSGDTFDFARGFDRNTRKVGTKSTGLRIYVFGKCTRPGAMPYEHYIEVAHVVDMVVTALEEILRSHKLAYVIRGGKFLDPLSPERAALPEIRVGAVYALQLVVSQGIFAADYAGDGLDTHTITAVESTIEVSATTAPTPEEI